MWLCEPVAAIGRRRCAHAGRREQTSLRAPGRSCHDLRERLHPRAPQTRPGVCCSSESTVRRDAARLSWPPLPCEVRLADPQPVMSHAVSPLSATSVASNPAGHAASACSRGPSSKKPTEAHAAMPPSRIIKRCTGMRE
eukprot:scaffold28481_cov129-Isochrysis_galbana.AAC.4